METLNADVVVLGSGAAGLTAALRAADSGAKVVILEKSHLYGGATALSFGTIYVPNNKVMPAHGIKDTPERAATYLKAYKGVEKLPEISEEFLASAPRMFDFVVDKTGLDFGFWGYADYCAELPGGMRKGRSIAAGPIDGRSLGDALLSLQTLHPELSMEGYVAKKMPTVDLRGVFMTSQLITVAKYETQLRIAAMFGREYLRYFSDIGARIRFGSKDAKLVQGPALIGGLRKALIDRNVPLWLRCNDSELCEEKGKLTGVTTNANGRKVKITVSRAVILATGGFSRNQALRDRFLGPGTSADWSTSVPTSDGGGILLAERMAGSLEKINELWGLPVMMVPGHQTHPMFNERGLPGSIIVSSDGKRFANEAKPYDAFGADVMREYKHGRKCFYIFDKRCRSSFVIGPYFPGGSDDKYQQRFCGHLVKADTLEGLAGKLGLPSDVLCETVREFNEGAYEGFDHRFKRGENFHDIWSANRPGTLEACGNPSIAPIDEGPFYAFQVFPGDLGTAGGIRTDRFSRVLTASGDVVDKLYAVGNDSAHGAVMGYPGAGATIGPGMTFGYVAANHALRR